ncbi:MAG: pyridoxal phosphate-dependent aminotransferase [Deltaproteobacteria bacterium]|nr:pyridoxal phosphate-dependent aminotransferase [Deltaproteobacteria bacterium]
MARIYLSPPHMLGGERELILDAFDSNWIAPLGPHVTGFEAEIAARAGVGHAAALSSGTGGLHLALMLLGVGEGDQVIVPSMTFVATANAVRYVGAEPVFIDSDRRTWNLDPDLLEEHLSACAKRGALPKAVLPVDLYGQCADYDRIVPICQTYDIPIIEDAAEALGARWSGQPAGSFGRLAVFSFNGNKIITTSGGGMLVSDDERLIVQARKLATQAREPAPHYEHAEVGYNYRMSNILAALGRGQLANLDAMIAARRENFEYYREHLGSLDGIEMMPIDPRGEPNYWLTCLTIDPDAFGCDREAVRLALEARDIESRPLWKPMHMQPIFRTMPQVGGSYVERLFDDGLCLPSGSSLTPEDRERVVEGVLTARA